MRCVAPTLSQQMEESVMLGLIASHDCAIDMETIPIDGIAIVGVETIS